jgi:hypothetical protein
MMCELRKYFEALAGELPESFIATHEHLQSRDVAEGFGHFEAACRFAELLLNAGLPHSETDEIALEGERGFRGVAPGSAEIRIWLPGSIGYSQAQPENE